MRALSLSVALAALLVSAPTDGVAQTDGVTQTGPHGVLGLRDNERVRRAPGSLAS